MTNKPSKILKRILISLTVLMFALPYLILHFYIPSQMSMFIGADHNFDYNLPIEAEIITSVDDDLVLVDHNPLGPKKEIEINRPVSVTFKATGEYKVNLKLFGFIPLKEVSVDVIEPTNLIPCGKTIGVDMETDGILVLGLGSVQSTDGKYYEPCKSKLYTGDLILEANQVLLENQYDLIDTVEKSNGAPVELKINRYGTYKTIMVNPVKSAGDETYKLGIWVRDSTQGIGTITYINPESKFYGALGHGINDVDTKELITIKKGVITNAEILSVTKGEKGAPGEVEAVLLSDEKNTLGDVRVNTNVGIFGKITNTEFDLLQKQGLPIALMHEVEEGTAHILTDVTGNGISSYEVELTKVSNFNNQKSKGMIVKITDERLIKYTNGIVQGMSGSPIIQNDKIVGAVTHVFVQNPYKGYGVYIETMLKNEKNMVQ